MSDAFLVYLLVTLVPIAFPLGIAPGTERVLFTAWRWVQLGVLVWALGDVVWKLVRARWIDRLLTLFVVAALIYAALSYAYVEFDAQIEYHRVLQLADRYHGLWNGYRHGVSSWILGYPPGTSLSIMWYRWLRLPSPNMAQGVLVVIWFVTFLTRYLRSLDAAAKSLFVAMLLTAPLVAWHLTFFYNNLFYALIWAELVMLPLYEVEQAPWERAAYALVLVWLRPQWQLAAIPILSNGLGLLASLRGLDWRRVRDIVITTLVMLLVAWMASSYWARTAARLKVILEAERTAVEHAITAQQDPHVLHLEVESNPVPRQAPEAVPIFSERSARAVRWAWIVTMESYTIGVVFLIAAALLALIVLRWRGLVYLVPLLSPGGIIVGTAFFARAIPEYTANSWALERMQIVVPILAAMVAAALHRHLLPKSDSNSTRSNRSRNPPTPAL